LYHNNIDATDFDEMNTKKKPLSKKELRKKAKEKEKKREKREILMLKVIAIIMILYTFYLITTRAMPSGYDFIWDLHRR